jgi:adenylate cyclase
MVKIILRSMRSLLENARMDREGSADVFLFEGFRLDRRGGVLYQMDREGVGTPVTLGSRAFNLLSLLIERKGELASKDEIMNAVWPGRVVEEANLNVQIAKLRHILDQNREHGSCIQTISGRGYCFVGVVGELGGSPTVSAGLQGSPAHLPLPDQPSIAVLPFTNMSSDPEQDYFSDGIAEDIITAVSRYPSLFVIARNSSFTYKGRAVDVKQVGRELGVRYLLEGGVRKAGNRIRVTAQLVEAESGKHVWAEHYDRELADIFAVQDEITAAVTIAIVPAVADAELRRAIRKPPQSLDAWAASQRGWWHVSKVTSEDNLLAEKFFQQAIDLDPRFAGAYLGLSIAQSNATDFQRRSPYERPSSVEVLARQAVALDPANAEARSCLAGALYRSGDYEGGLAEVECALAISPNLAYAHGVLGAILVFSGRPKEGIAALERTIRLDPRDPQRIFRLNQIALGLYFLQEYGAAVDAAKRAIRSYPNFPNTYRWLAAALGQLDRIEEAKAALEKAMLVVPGSLEMSVRRRVPWMRPEDHDHMLQGLRKAGWKE